MEVNGASFFLHEKRIELRDRMPEISGRPDGEFSYILVKNSRISP